MRRAEDEKTIFYRHNDRLTGKTLISPDFVTSSDTLKQLLGEYQERAAFDLVDMLEACDKGEEFFDPSTLPFSTVSERRSFILDLEAQYEATHEWVRVALVHQAAIDRAEAVLTSIASSGKVDSGTLTQQNRKVGRSAVGVSSSIHSVDDDEAQSPLQKLEDELADDQSVKISECSRSSSLDSSSLDEEDFSVGKLNAKMNLLTSASRKRFECDILARKVKRDALVRKVKVRCEHVSEIVKGKMPRKKSDSERKDTSELRVYHDVLKQASADRTLLEHMEPYAAAAFETQWGQEMADTLQEF